MAHLEEKFEGGVLTLTMNRPEARNAMSGEMMQLLEDAIPRAADDPEVRCLVLTGTGGAFCSGGDVKGFASGGASSSDQETKEVSYETRVQSLRQQMEVSRQLHVMPKPTIAVIPGPAAGAGLSLALACDLRFCLDSAKLTTAFSKIGASGDYGGSYFLPKLVGAAKARELYFTADIISGKEAFDLGIVSKIAPASSFEQEADEYVNKMANLPTVALGYIKKNLNAAETASIGEVFDLEAAHMMRTFMTDDHKQAVNAFIKKEPPVFRGR